MKTLKGTFKSQEMKIINANKMKLGLMARQIYLQGIARLGKAEEVAQRGNNGKGFRVASMISEPRKEKQVKF